MNSNNRSFILGSLTTIGVVVILFLAFQFGKLSRGPLSNLVNPEQITLGPQPSTSAPQENDDIVIRSTDELYLKPRESIDVQFSAAYSGPGHDCSNVTCSIRFTWSVRAPYPYPRNQALVEFFDEKQGAHQVISSTSYGEADVGYYTPVRVANRSDKTVLLEIRYALVKNKQEKKRSLEEILNLTFPE